MYIEFFLNLQDKPNLVVAVDPFAISNLDVNIIASMDIGLQSSLCAVSLPGFCIRVILALSKKFASITVFPFSFSVFYFLPFFLII